jgi:hypothetical protein
VKARTRTRGFGLALFLALALAACSGRDAKEESVPTVDRVDPVAVGILAKMTKHMRGLEQFSVETQITLEDWLESGHIADTDISTRVTILRPDKIRSERRGDLVDQDFYYDGKTLTLHNPADHVYATVDAPSTITGTVEYARETLGLSVPASDLLYPDAFTLLMKDVTHAAAVGKAVIGGVRCDHLLFVRPGVDFQIWVAESGAPLPMKYVVTDTQHPERLRITTVMSDWNTSPGATDELFTFRPPEGARAVTFLPLITKDD